MHREQLEQLFVENLGAIERAVAVLCRRYGVAPDEADDVASWVKTRLIEDDYAAIGKFRGESAIATYLTVVVAMLFRDYRNQRWGRWRPSAAAQRIGAHAVRLETLVVRDGLTLREAGERLRTAGTTTLDDRELAELLAKFPSRGPMRPIEVGSEALAAQPAAAGADDAVWREAADEDQRVVLQALDRAMDRLPPEERTILRLRFWQDLSVADIARVLHLEQKPLYRRIDRALGKLRGELETAGVGRHALTLLTEHAGAGAAGAAGTA